MGRFKKQMTVTSENRQVVLDVLQSHAGTFNARPFGRNPRRSVCLVEFRMEQDFIEGSPVFEVQLIFKNSLSPFAIISATDGLILSNGYRLPQGATTCKFQIHKLTDFSKMMRRLSKYKI